MPEGTVSDDVGSKLLFENDRVRVWDLRLEPGQSTGLHRHTEDYLYVVIGGGALKGSGGEPTEMADGHVAFREIPGEEIHEAVNAGDKPWRNIIVELKD